MRRTRNVQLWCKRISGLAAILLMAGLLLPALHTYASSWTGLQGALYADETAVPADGTSKVDVLLVLRDQDGHPVDLSPDQIRLHATLGTWAGEPTAGGNGTYTAVLTAPTTAGVSYISAEAAGVTVTDLARVYFKPGAPSAEHSVLTASRYSLPADGISQTVISLQLKDANGNDIAEPAEGLQLFTTGGQLGSVTHVTYGSYKASVVSAVYGLIGSLAGAEGTGLQPEGEWVTGAIPPGTPNDAPLPASLSFTYETYGTYRAALTAPGAEGGATVTASLNGVPVTSSVYVAFSNDAVQIEPVSLRFSQDSYGVRVGQQVSVGLSALWSDQSYSSVTPFAAYRVADASIAAVDPEGIVHGLKAGQTVLTATYGHLSKDAAIVVTAPIIDPTPPSSPGNPGPSLPATPAPPDTAIRIEVVPEGRTGESQTVTLEAIQKGTVPISLPADGGEIRISGASLGEIAKVNPQTVLVLQAGGASMSVPIAELSTKAYSEKFNMAEKDIQFHFIVHPPEAPIEAAVKRTADRMKARMLAPAMAFEVQVTGENGKSAFIGTFNRYVTRTLTLAEDTVPATATGVWWIPETNEFHYVPTHFEKINGHWAAVMMRQGASVYTVIDRPVTFGDVKDHWGKASVELLASKLIIEGQGKDVFAPDAPITRAEVAALLVRALGLTPSDAKSPFTDIAGGWYEQTVNTAYRAGLVAGYEDGTFRPDQPVTREELVQLIVGAMAFTEVKTEGKARNAVYPDEDTIAAWAMQAVNKAAETGIIDGDGPFRPASLSTRAEAAAMLERMLKLVQFIQ